MERKLLLLGLLRSQEMHGYQLNEFIDGHLGVGVHLKKPTAYRLLNKMAEEGWVTFREEQDGNRPLRRVYAITPQGEVAFQKLLRESLANYQPVDSLGNVGVLFIETILAEEAVSLLQERRTVVEGLLRATHTHEVHHEGSQLMLLYRTRHLTTEMGWLDEVIARLGSPSEDLALGEELLPEQPGEAGSLPHPQLHEEIRIHRGRAEGDVPPHPSHPPPDSHRPSGRDREWPKWHPEID